MTSARLQVMVAHPDDETFACGSLLLHAAEAGFETVVGCATRGEAGEQAAHSAEGDLGLQREGELRAAAALLGASRVDLLGYADSGMRGTPGPGTLAGAPFGQVVDAVAELLTTVRPDILVTLDASDGHRDHVRIRDATVEAARRRGVPRTYLHCLPRSLIKRWVAHMRQGRPDVEHLDGDVEELGTPDEDITTVLDTSRHLAVREQAIALHRSQVSPFDGLPEGLRRDFLTADHLRRVTPHWRGGARETSLLG
jgi:LmbE family N-acetylglucosaminyl deacetylase